jgi:deoxyribonuclease IV
MKWIGAHVSAAGGVEYAPLNARAIGATAFAMFTKNQRQWRAKPLDRHSVEAFNRNLADCGLTPAQVLVHDSYLINIGNADEAKRQKSFDAFVDELRRCEALGLPLLNIHPGSHLNQVSEDECLGLIADAVNRALASTRGVTVVLENTAGQGTSVGYRFEHLGTIIDRVEDKPRIGICIDTCHAFAAGYDLTTDEGYEETMELVDRTVGLSYLRGMHLNDAKSALASRVDRHQSLGKGHLGLDAFRRIMQDKRLDRIPLILETIDEALYAQEIALLREMAAADA